MYFNLLILFAMVAIIFVHYVRGLFSGIISAILAAFSAVFALSYYEPLTERFLAGKFANTAHAMMLLILFSVTYLVLRLIFDKAVPGNVRVPAVADKVGGAIMGVFAAIFAVGSVAIAGQMLPFSPAPGGFQKYPMSDKNSVVVPAGAGKRNLDAATYDELRTDASASFGDESERQGFWIISPDEIVVSLTEHLSDGGALSRRPMRDIHPDLLAELFGQRLGIQTGGQHVVMNKPGHRTVSTIELYEVDSAPIKDFEYAKYRQKRAADIEKMGTLRAKPNEVILIARVMFERAAADPDDFMLRFSPGSVRLVGEGMHPNGEIAPKDYHPYGTMDQDTLIANKMDDFLFADLHTEDKGVDFAFLVERNRVDVEEPGKDNVVGHMRAGTFLEINRMTRLDLSGMEIKRGPAPANAKIQVLRKTPAIGAGPTQQPTTPTTPTPTTPTPPTTPAAQTAGAKIVGEWAGTSDSGDVVLDFRADGAMSYVTRSGPGTGSWKIVSQTPDSVTIERTINGQTTPATITFQGDGEMSYQPKGGKVMKMTRRK